jgi:hypothetical protein
MYDLIRIYKIYQPDGKPDFKELVLRTFARNEGSHEKAIRSAGLITARTKIMTEVYFGRKMYCSFWWDMKDRPLVTVSKRTHRCEWIKDARLALGIE